MSAIQILLLHISGALATTIIISNYYTKVKIIKTAGQKSI